MNEEANFCNQCGSKINSDAKFCSNCGCDLQNSSTKTPPDENMRDTPKQSLSTEITVISLMLISVAGFLIIMAVNNREPLTEPDRIDKELKVLPQEEQSNETTQSESIVQFGWKVSGSADPASRVIIARSARVRSDDGLCQMSVLHRPQGSRGTEFECEFKFTGEKELTIKFDNDDSYHRMIQFYVSSENTIFVQPYIPDNSFDAMMSRYTSEPDRGNSFKYYEFINGLISANFVAIELIPTEKSGPVWIRFPLKGAKEAIAKLGKELETAPNISND